MKLLTVLGLLAASVAGQEPSTPATIVPRAKAGETAAPLPGANIRVDSNLVLIPVSVADALNRPVTGLDQEVFEIAEDKVKQRITSFGGEDAPLSVGIVFDTSGSMSSKLGQARQAVSELFKVANPEDEAFLVEFNDRPEVAMPFTHNLDDIRARLVFTKAKGRTALLDGALLGLRTMKKAKNPRRALIVISDGVDNSSRYTQSELKNVVKEADVQIYSIALYSNPNDREELMGVDLLRNISEPTGGRIFVVANVNDLPDVAGKIGIELRNQYVLGYSPSNGARDGRYRKVAVKIIQQRGLPPLHASWRTGYYAPTQ
jgi:Ca-activated chloride channel family protein